MVFKYWLLFSIVNPPVQYSTTQHSSAHSLTKRRGRKPRWARDSQWIWFFRRLWQYWNISYISVLILGSVYVCVFFSFNCAKTREMQKGKRQIIMAVLHVNINMSPSCVKNVHKIVKCICILECAYVCIFSMYGKTATTKNKKSSY